MLLERSILLAKKEGSYGVDPTLSASEDAFITSVPNITPLGNHRERNVARAGMGMPGGLNVGEGIQVEFSTELKGSDYDADGPPKIFRLFEACGMDLTIESLVKATLKPNSNHDGVSIAMIVNFDGTQHKILGCRGTYTIDFNNNDVVMINFTFSGLYAGNHASAVSFPAGTFDESSVERLLFRSAGLGFNSVNTLVIENITFNPNFNVFRRPGSNAASGTHAYSIVSRAPELNLEPEAVALATLDPWTLYNDSSEFTISFGVQDSNNTPGQQYTFNFYRCQLQDPPNYGSRESIRTWSFTAKPHATIEDGNNDFEIICTLPSES